MDFSNVEERGQIFRQIGVKKPTDIREGVDKIPEKTADVFYGRSLRFVLLFQFSWLHILPVQITV